MALLLPASELAIAFVQRVAARLAPPRRLPRLDFTSGIPESARTLVVVPTLLTKISDVAERIEHLEVLALGNLDPRIHFAILSDFADAASREMPDDDAILSAARAGSGGVERTIPRRRLRPLLSVSSRAAMESRRERLDGMGAQARQDRRAQSPAARGHRHQRSRFWSATSPSLRASVTASRSIPTLVFPGMPRKSSSASSPIL